MAKINRQIHKSINMTRLETWLGNEKIAKLQVDMKGWYGRPIYLIDVPGSVWIHADGSFTGTMQRGYFYSALDSLEDYAKRFWREAGRLEYGQCNAGFASIANAIARSAQGNSQRIKFDKDGIAVNTGFSASSWRSGRLPVAGLTPAGAPGGAANASSDTGAFPFSNPASGTLHLVGADIDANVSTNTLLLYDRLFSVAATASSTATEAVTGVPTRYQSTTVTDVNYAGDNFLFVEVFTTLGATAHNWTVCQYTNQAGTTTKELPSLTGISSSASGRLDHPVNQWFAPLADNDTGIKALTQMQCSASVTGSATFIIGHPIGFMTFPLNNVAVPFDWLISSEQAPRIFDDACLAFIEPSKASGTAGSYRGKLVLTSAAA